MLRRFLCVTIIILLLVLPGCNIYAPKAEPVSPITIGTTQSEPKYLFAVNSAEVAVATLFCEKVWDLSDGTLSIGVIETADPHNALTNDEAALAFLSAAELRQYNDCFDAFLAPFAFRDYSHLTMSSNYQPLFDIANQELETLHVFGGFYFGSSYFLASQPLADHQQILSLFFDEEAIPAALTLPNSRITEGFRRFGFDTREVISADERFLLLENAEAVIAEFTTRELIASSEWLNSNLTFINVPHNFNIAWLTGTRTFYSELTPKQKAAVLEAQSHMFALLDESCLRDENRIVQGLSVQNFATSTLPEAFRTGCNNTYFSLLESSPLFDYAITQIEKIRQ